MKELIAKIRSLPSGENMMRYSPIQGSNACGFKTDDLITLADRLAAYEEAMTETNDIRGFGWHVQRRRENDRVEWFSSDSQGRVFGPFDTTLEAFAALKGETNNAG